MKLFEKYFPETRRFRIFAWIYLVFFTTLLSFLFLRQVIQREDYVEKERKQGQRRILRPGARGDVFDRNYNLLIGNRANYSANLHLELLNREIWEQKIKLRRKSYALRNQLNQFEILTFEDFLKFCYEDDHVKRRKIRISGHSLNDEDKVILFAGEKRMDVNQKGKTWTAQIENFISKKNHFIRVSGSRPEVSLNIAGLFSLDFELDQQGYPKPIIKYNNEEITWIDLLFEDQNNLNLNFSTNGISQSWEARYEVVRNYIETINEITGRKTQISLSEVQKHWRSKLVLPLEICADLTNHEYALLIEKLPPESPIQIQAKAVRHYPYRYLASHVLGYVGSGYEANPNSQSGSDLATFELKGRTGKAGIEKIFDHHLRGSDGIDIWIVNPMGSRFERVERQPSEKGKSIQLTIDTDLQQIAENSIDQMVEKVSNQRILPDRDWAKTLERRTGRALLGTNETEVRAELLLSAFKDAPFPLTGGQASTVAGFKGTEEDANRLLRHLYAQGVLQRGLQNPSSFTLAPPPPPPGAAVLIDLESFEILALASKPNYDLSSLTPFISQAAYDEIQRREAWLPRAWHPGYAPASPFKLITTLAGLRATTLDPKERLLCEGIYRGMKCHVHPGQHGELALREAIAQSCNVYFFRCAEKMGHDKLIAEARRLGMDQKPFLNLPSLRDIPIVPDPVWKKNNLEVKWTMEDTFNISIGQGGLRQSPLQMACFMAKLATNLNSISPIITYEDKKEDRVNDILINKEDRLAILEGMVLATSEGTARRCQIEGIQVAGKTGTGQWRNHNMKLNLAWFVGFAPAYAPRVAVSVLIEGVIPQDQVQGGLTATPIAKDLLAAYFAKYPDSLSSN